MTHPQPIRASKRAVNVSVDSNLVAEARELGIPLSGTLETALRTRVKEERDRRWMQAHQAWAEDYNRFIAENGVFGDDVRLF